MPFLLWHFAPGDKIENCPAQFLAVCGIVRVEFKVQRLRDGLSVRDALLLDQSLPAFDGHNLDQIGDEPLPNPSLCFNSFSCLPPPVRVGFPLHRMEAHPNFGAYGIPAPTPRAKKRESSLATRLHIYAVAGNGITSGALAVIAANVTRCACAMLCSRRKWP